MPGSTKAKQPVNSKSASGGQMNNSFSNQKPAVGGKVPNMGAVNNKLVPQLYMRGYSPSKPQWKF